MVKAFRPADRAWSCRSRRRTVSSEERRFYSGREGAPNLGQFAEVALVDVSGDAVVGLAHVLADKREGVGGGQQREELVLLRLVVQNLGLWLSAGGTPVFSAAQTNRPQVVVS